MLAITNESAYRICYIQDNSGNCHDECTSNLLVREDGNICGGTCAHGKYLIVPEGVCVSNCDSSIYVTKDNAYGLCKDVNSTHQYKIINGIECLSEKPHNNEYIMKT